MNGVVYGARAVAGERAVDVELEAAGHAAAVREVGLSRRLELEAQRVPGRTRPPTPAPSRYCTPASSSSQFHTGAEPEAPWPVRFHVIPAAMAGAGPKSSSNECTMTPASACAWQ